MSRTLRFLMIGVAIATIGFLVWARPPGVAARDRAIEIFISTNGSACIGTADFFLNEGAVAQKIAEADPHAGWVEENLIFVGSLDEALASVKGEVIASDDSGTWVNDARQAPALLGLQKRTGGKNTGFVVPERYTAC